MKNTIKTLALFTTGLVVGVVVGRVKEKKIVIDGHRLSENLSNPRQQDLLERGLI
ncbi:hypothetical protein [Jeotgalibaca porci]|uniref:hypothetical protein n=1 Tax=Jeotgalibaca porci TaxID=1868793 RepID=UPI0035A13AEF